MEPSIKVAPRKYQEHNGGTKNMMEAPRVLRRHQEHDGGIKSRKEAPRV